MSAHLLLLFPGTGGSWSTGTPTLNNQGLDDDTIQLGSQILAVRGAVTANAISEFEAGIKVGPATYDNREHAFYIVMDDFSGGFGTRFQRIRDEQGVFWDVTDAEGNNAADTRRAHHVTLPPFQEDLDMSDLSAAAFLPGAHKHMMRAGGDYVFGRGNGLYRLTISNLGAVSISSIHQPSGASYFFGITGAATMEARTGVAGQSGEGVVLSSTGGGSSSVSAGISMGGGHSASPAANVARRYFASFQGANYIVSENGLTWQAGAVAKQLGDLIYWSGKILASYNRGIIYAVWDADNDHEIWNIDDELDGEYVGLTAGPARDFFLGAMAAPWGEPAMYLYNYDKLYVLDFYARKMYPVDIGMGRAITDACIWNGAAILTDGWNIFEYSPNGNTVRNIGFPNKDGLPPSIRSETFPGTGGVIHGLIPADNLLFACVTKTTSGRPSSYLYCYNGTGWSQIGRMLPNAVLGSGIYGVGQNGHRRIVTYTAQMAQGGLVAAGLEVAAEAYHLPSTSNTPSVGLDTFGNGGAGLISSWQDGGFYDLRGTLLRMKIDALGLSSTDYVRVEYQVDNQEDSAWILLVDSNNTQAVFDGDHDTLYFSEDADGDLRTFNPRTGIAFTTVRFRVTLERGGEAEDATNSPELRALTLMYLKVPEFRASWTFNIDVSRMVERSATGTETMYYVDGEVATFKLVWEKLQEMWNSHQLVPLYIPSILDTDEPLYVRISDMPANFDDFRDAMEGDGTITITLIEPLERVPL